MARCPAARIAYRAPTVNSSFRRARSPDWIRRSLTVICIAHPPLGDGRRHALPDGDPRVDHRDGFGSDNPREHIGDRRRLEALQSDSLPTGSVQHRQLLERDPLNMNNYPLVEPPRQLQRAQFQRGGNSTTGK